MNKIKIEIEKISDWDKAYEMALFTQRKVPKTKYPSSSWINKMCYAEHSPIREVKFIVKFYDVENFVIQHLARHVHAQPYVSTQRSDLTGLSDENINRLTPNNLVLSLNAQEIIHISKERLCNKSHVKTKEVWQKFLEGLRCVDEKLYLVCVPKCIYRGFCPELKKCGYVKSEEFQEIRQQYINNMEV